MAAVMCRHLVKKESRGHGDTDDAMRRIERRHRLPMGLLWSLRYRRPRGIFWHVFEQLQAVYRLECARQAELLARQMVEARKKSGAAAVAPYLDKINALLREASNPNRE